MNKTYIDCCNIWKTVIYVMNSQLYCIDTNKYLCAFSNILLLINPSYLLSIFM